MLCRSNADDTEGQITKVEKLSIKKKGIGSEARAERMAKADVDLQLLGHAEQERHMQKQKKRRLQGREEDVCVNFPGIMLVSFNLFYDSMKKSHLLFY